MTTRQVTIYWPDYTMTKAPSATRALEIIAEKQWEEHVSVRRMKELLANRAWAWCKAEIDPLAPDEEFLTMLGETGMVFVWYGDGDPWIGLNERGLA